MIFSTLTELGKQHIAGPFAHLFSEAACWSTGSEYLDDVKVTIERVLAADCDDIPDDIDEQLRDILNCISDWHAQVAKRAVSYYPRKSTNTPSKKNESQDLA
jgi:hypothetical protein